MVVVKPLGDHEKIEIDFPNGMHLSISYGTIIDKEYYKESRFRGNIRKIILLDSKGEIIDQLVENNPDKPSTEKLKEIYDKLFPIYAEFQ